MSDLTVTSGGGWDTGTLTIGTGTTSFDWSLGTTTYHHCYWGCPSHPVVWMSTGPAHEHDYQQADGDDFRGVLYCRKCGETKNLKPRKRKEP